MSLLNVNKANIAHAKAHVRAYGHVFLHGDGNMYFHEEDSSFRKEFTNPRRDGTPAPSSYALRFTSVEAIPDSVKALEDLFLKEKNREQIKTSQIKSVAAVKTFALTADELAALKKDDGAEEDDDTPYDPQVKARLIAEQRVQSTRVVDGKDHDKEAELSKDQRIALLEAQLEALKGGSSEEDDKEPAPLGTQQEDPIDTRTPAQKRADTLAARKGPATSGGTGIEI